MEEAVRPILTMQGHEEQGHDGAAGAADDLFRDEAEGGDDEDPMDDDFEGFFHQGWNGEQDTPKSHGEDEKLECDHEDPQEAQEPKFKCIPCLPTSHEIVLHDLSHLPYRNWCPICVKAKAKEDPHRRKADGYGEENGLPIISLDYELLEEKMTMLVAKDNATGCVLSYDCICKGPNDEWVVKQLIKDIETWGRKDICLKTDGEPAIVALQTEVIKQRTARTVPMNPPAYDPQGNGAAEKAVQDVTAELRCLKLALEARLKCNIDPKHAVVKWMMPHAAFLITRLSKGHDGLTSWRRLMKRNWSGMLAEFGESVWAKLQLKKSPVLKKVKRGKKKLIERSIPGVWLGIYVRTGENIILKNNGDVVRVRTITRRPRSQRFEADKILGMEALPRRPTPSVRKQNADIDGQLNDDDRVESGRERASAEQQDRAEGGADLGEAEPRRHEYAPREFRIDTRLLEKFGFTPGCPGCDHKRDDGAYHRAHTKACRQRLYELMKEDADEIDILLRKDERMEARARPTIPREAAIPEHREVPEGRGPDVPIQEPERTEPRARAPDRVHQEVPEKAPDVEPDREMQAEDGVRNDNDEPNEMNSDEIPREFDLESEDDDDDGDVEERQRGGPSEKRQRVSLIRRRPPPETAVGRSIASTDPLASLYGAKEGPAVEPKPALKQQLNALKVIIDKPDVKKILKELEKLPKFQLDTSDKGRSHLREHVKDVAEVYSPPRMTTMASRMGLKAAWALDLTQVDPVDGQMWDLSVKSIQDKAKAALRRDRPLMLVACPMCGPFSSLMNWNYAKMTSAEVENMLDKALEHLKFALELCVEQHRAGRLFLFEHPVGASSWETEMIAAVARLSGVHIAKFDFCQLGMVTKDKDGKKSYAKKRTGVMTNSQHVAKILREAQCQGSHLHTQLLDGRAGPCQDYPDKFCRVVCNAIKREVSDTRWRKKVWEDISDSVESIMSAMQKIEALEPPEEKAWTSALYEGRDFYDDVSGALLDKDKAIKARAEEMEFFREHGVYSKVPRQQWMKIIETKWLDINKGDALNPNYRARLVGCEINREKRDDLFAATPPLESLKAVVSLCSSRQGRRHPHRIMSIDVKRAYFYAPAVRPIYIRIPKEDWEEGDQGRVGKLNLSLYGTRDAAMNWTGTYTKFLEACGFTRGKGSPCNFHHPVRDMAMTVHGDDFTCSGAEHDLRWLEARMSAKFDVKCEVLGPNPEKHKQEIRVLNRVLTWGVDGIIYEPDQRHAELVVRELGLVGSKAVVTPGCREDANKASDLPQEVEDQDRRELCPAQARVYRGVAARLNYLAQDRAGIQYACKEASRRMATPCEGDFGLLKRIGRYLVGAPRYQQRFYWQDEVTEVDGFTDSDWAGCKSTARSTSGGAVKLGLHCLKTWSSTQAIVALSSAEAELYALTKGAAQLLGIMTLLSDFGVDVKGVVHTDASAAIGIVRRQGLGKVRHLRVQYLWMQDRVRGGDVDVKKVDGKINPADLMTKHLPAHDVHRHLDSLGMSTGSDRAATAPHLSVVKADGRWLAGQAGELSVVHETPRRTLVTPPRVQGAPPVRGLTAYRLTKGVFCDNGEEFTRRDNWTSRASAHADLGRRWTGSTTFVTKDSMCS